MGAKNGESDKGGFKGKRSARGASVAGEQARSRQNRGQDVGTSGKEFDEKTGFKTSSGFLKDKYGNLVRSKRQVERFNEQKALRDAIAQNIQAQEAKQVTPTRAGITSVMDRMKRDRQNLLDRAKQNRITNQQLNQLSKLNRNLGFNRTTGMGIIESFRDTFSDPAFRAGLGNLARAYLKISPLGIVMRNILNPQYDQPTGIQSLPDFQGLQRSNMMIGPGVYDFTQPTRMPSNMAGTIPGLSPPTQFADASQSDINTINLMKQSMDLPDIQRYYEGTTVTPEEVEGIYEGTITSPTGQFAII